MPQDDRHSGNVILLRVACITLLLALVEAWCLVGTHVMQLPIALEVFKDPDKLLSSHLDFLMMTMLLLGFYRVSHRSAAARRTPPGNRPVHHDEHHPYHDRLRPGGHQGVPVIVKIVLP